MRVIKSEMLHITKQFAFFSCRFCFGFICHPFMRFAHTFNRLEFILFTKWEKKFCFRSNANPKDKIAGKKLKKNNETLFDAHTR